MLTRLRIGALFALLCCGTACQRPLGAPAVQPRYYSVSAEIEPGQPSPEGAAVAATIAPYAAQLEEQMNRVIAEVATPLTKDRPESSLGNWTADLLLRAARDLFPDRSVAFAVQNYGGLRVSEIGAGPLLVSEIFELMPFDNELVLVELDGASLLALAEHMADAGGWPVSEGVSVTRGGERPEQVLVDGRAVVTDQTYYVAMPDYVANGGDEAAMLAGRPQLASNRLVRDLLIDYAGRTVGPITATTDGSRFKLDTP